MNGVSGGYVVPGPARSRTPAPPPPAARRERQLRDRADRLFELARTQPGLTDAAPPAGSEPTEALVQRLAALTTAAIDRLEALPAGAPDEQAQALQHCAADAIELQEELRRLDRSRRREVHEQVQQALARMRKQSNSADLIDRMCLELVGIGDFRRAILTRVQDGLWLPWIACFPGDPTLEREFVEWMTQQQFPVSELGEELLALRPVLVLNAVESAGAFSSMIDFSKTHSYIAAPIAPAGRLVGVVYVDCYPTERVLDEWDRDVLWSFCEDFARIYERTVLLERMRSQRQEVRDAYEHAESMMSALAAAEIELVPGAGENLDATTADDRPAFETPIAAPIIGELLTDRETEVIGMMVRGASNREIAERLLIKPGTVKSHVKHILRKLDAVNRAEAIARYMGLERGASL